MSKEPYVRKIGNEEVIVGDRSPDQVGYQVRQLNTPDDAPINPYGLNVQMNGRVGETELGGLILTREERADAHLKETHARLKENGVDFADLLEGIDPVQLGMSSAQYRYMRSQALRERQHRQRVQEEMNGYQDDEAGDYPDGIISEPAPRRASSGTWRVIQQEAKLNNGQKIPVYRVVEAKTKTPLGHIFRVQEAAERAQAILNQSGNITDQRLVKLIETEKRHTALTKELRQVRTAIREGNTSLKGKYQNLMLEIEQINLKLGI